MNVLAVDTFSATLQVALKINDRMIIKTKSEERTHAKFILPLVDECLNEMGANLKQLDAIAFGVGPGSFTGLRIACSVAQALGFALDIPLKPVSNLRALAQSAYRLHGVSQVHTIIDARMQEVYAASFILSAGIMHESSPEQVTSPQDLSLNLDGDWAIAGNGYKLYEEAFKMKLDSFCGYFPDCYPHIEDIVFLADYVDDLAAVDAVPTYIRNQVAWRKENG